MNVRVYALVLALSVSAASVVHARSCVGVSFPDSVIISGKTLVLNGLGLREATIFNVDVFIAALYVEQRSSDAKTLLARDRRTRVELHFVRETSAADIAKEMDAGYRANAPKASSAKKKALFAWLKDMRVGDATVFTYEPGKGLEVKVAGKVRGTIAGSEFASATLSVLIGPKAGDEGLRAGMLGGRCD